MKEEEGTGQSVKAKREYKLWVLGAIIMLALWSMFTASLTLKWSAGNLTRNFDSPTVDDFDVLAVEEREKVVRRMWNVYSKGKSSESGSGLPRFWSDAFHAAYDHMVSDVLSVRDAAVSEIAKMSLRSLPLHSNIKGYTKIKQAEADADTTLANNQ